MLVSHDLPRWRPVAQARAKELRRDRTAAEELVWSMVRGKRLGRLKFHRQFPIGPYIADFFCPAKKLVVEIDGDSHEMSVEHDAARTESLRRQRLYQSHEITARDVFTKARRLQRRVHFAERHLMLGLVLQAVRVGNHDMMSNREGVEVFILRKAGCDPKPWLEGRWRNASSP